MKITNETDIPLGLAVWILQDPLTGNLYWKKNRGPVRQGSIAGYVSKTGYVSIRFEGKLYYAHRIMWFLETGESPEFLDHINGDPSDNRISNLRVVTRKQNNRNSTKSTNNTSGYKGVSWSKSWKKWIAVITVNYKHILLGGFLCPKEAANAYDNAATKYHGEYAKTNKHIGLI